MCLDVGRGGARRLVDAQPVLQGGEGEAEHRGRTSQGSLDARREGGRRRRNAREDA